MENIKIRCSRLGDIMSTPRSKGELISATAKTYMQELYLENKYGIKKEFWSRYTDKGIQVEKDSIALANEVLNWGLSFDYIENGGQDAFENEYLTGRVDVLTENFLGEIKSSFDGTTFPFFEDELPNKNYFFQVHGYMMLTGLDRCTIAYCLVNTPEDIVLDEIRREHWRLKLISDDEEVEQYVRSKHNFDHIPKQERVKAYVIERNDAVIENIKEKVELCREYYNSLNK